MAAKNKSDSIGKMKRSTPNGIRIQPVRIVKAKKESDSIGKMMRSSPNDIRIQPVRKLKAEKESDSIGKMTSKNASALIVKKSIKEKKIDSFVIGDDVLAKQKYSVPWPSKVIAIRSKCVDVFFYGDGRNGAVKRDEIYSVVDSHEVILDCLRRKIPTYLEGIKEMEKEHQIPDELSLLHRM